MVKIRLKKPRSSIDLRKRGEGIDLRKKKPDLEEKPDPNGRWKPPLIRTTEPQKGLQQLGDTPVWTTPLNTPISPFDCERWPSSPYCGSNPISHEAVGFEIEIVNDECYLGVQLSGSLGFIKSPNLQINIRKPSGDCDPPPLPKTPQHPPRQPPPPIDPNAFVYVSLDGYSYIEEIHPNTGRVFGPAYLRIEKSEIRLPQSKTILKDTGNYEYEVELFYHHESRSWNFIYDSVHVDDGTPWGDYIKVYKEQEQRISKSREVVIGKSGGTAQIGYQNSKLGLSGGGYTYYYYPGVYGCITLEVEKGTLVRQGGAFLVYGKWGNVSPYIEALYDFFEWQSNLSSDSIDTFTYQVLTLDGKNHQPPPPPDPRPRERRKPPQPKKEECCVSCCEALLREIRLLRREVGFGNINLPQSLLTLEGKNQGNRRISSVTELLCRQVLYLDELFGKWELEVEIQDANPLQPGEQKQMLRVPNLSAAMGVALQTLIDTQQSAAVAKNAGSRSLLEVCQTKQQAAKIYWAVEAMIEYLGFKTEEKTEQINYLCRLFQQGEEGKTEAIGKASEFLQNSTMPTSRLAYQPSSKEENLQDILFDLAQAAAIIRAALFVRADENDPSSTLKERVKGQNANLEKLIDTQKSTEDFQQQLEYLENDWAHLPLKTDPDDPWGEPYENRPRIRDITPGNQQGGDTDGGRGGIG